MKHFVIGTAGHVDHGKTVLVKALTGKDTDRLKEEKERGISIELGFAPFRLPSGTMAGVVDVPGHERFIKNMLAGVGGMDMVLLVVAADEGIMPQTREHMDIIDLLQIPEGIIVITKTDLVDSEWLDMIKEEVRELVYGTTLEKAPVAEVSAATGKGIRELTNLIDQIAGELRERSITGQARMPVDRIFSITGFGTVVTGTLAEGRLHVGDIVEILPEEIEARVRGLQVHGQKVEFSEAGQRVAVNLAGIEREKIERGSVLAAPGFLKPSHRLDIRLKLLAGAEKPLVNRARVRVHIGTAEVLARVVLLEEEELNPGDSMLVQLECEEPIVAARGDRLVIRSYSPMTTIAGGKVIDPLPTKHKRLNTQTIEAIKTREKGTPEELIQQVVAASGKLVFSATDLAREVNLDEASVSAKLESMTAAGLVREFTVDSKRFYILNALFNQKADDMEASLKKFHQTYPLRAGISKEEIRSRHFNGLSTKLFGFLLELFQTSKVVKITGEFVSLYDFESKPGTNQENLFRKIENRYLDAGFQTPGWNDIVSEFKISSADSEEILNYFLNQDILVRLEDNILIHSRNLNKAREMVLSYLKEKGELSLAEARDLFQTSRKYTLPIVSQFDKERVTRRIEDKRVLY